MKMGMQFLALALLTSGISFATETWSGQLVDSKCYETRIANVNPRAPQTTATRDMSLVIRPCAPNTKTKLFGLVHEDWQMSKLNPSSNQKLIEFVRESGKRRVYFVRITGEVENGFVQVDSISLGE